MVRGEGREGASVGTGKSEQEIPAGAAGVRDRCLSSLLLLLLLMLLLRVRTMREFPKR